MIFLGLILLGAGYFAHLTFLWVLGGIITAGAALHAMGAFRGTKPANCETCHGEGKYRHYFHTEDNSIGAMEEGDNWEWRICQCSMPVERSRW